MNSSIIKLVGQYEANNYGGGEIQVISAPLCFNRCLTQGIKPSKWTKGKYTIGMELSEDQVKKFNESVVDPIKDQLKSWCLSKFKSGLYGKTLHVKLINDFYANDFLNDGEKLEFHQARDLRNYTANVTINVRGVYVNEDDEGFLQLMLSRLVVN